MQIAAVELDHPGGRGGERDEHTGGVDAAGHMLGGRIGAERHLLPGGVAGRGGRLARVRAERSGAGAGDDQALGGELRQRAGDGHRADPEPLHEGPAGRQLLSCGVALHLRPKGSCQVGDAVTLVHESRE